MCILAAEIEKALREKLPIAHVEVVDESSGCGENYNVLIVSSVRGKAPRSEHG